MLLGKPLEKLEEWPGPQERLVRATPGGKGSGPSVTSGKVSVRGKLAKRMSFREHCQRQ